MAAVRKEASSFSNYLLGIYYICMYILNQNSIDEMQNKTLIQGLSKRVERFEFGIFYLPIVKIRYNFTHK
jgi:hypothetical protein